MLFVGLIAFKIDIFIGKSTMVKITGTREAFSQMITEKNVYRKLGVERTTVSNWKAYIKENKKISIDKMEEMLKKYGAVELSPPVWIFQ